MIAITSSANAAGIFWTNGTDIASANLDGTGVNQSFIAGASVPRGIAVSGNFIYWTNNLNSGSSGRGTVGRASLDGTGVKQDFISLASTPGGVTVGGSFIYWTSPFSDTIGRANLDGTGVNANFITLPQGQPIGITAHGNSSTARV
jgi:hypothetical protein